MIFASFYDLLSVFLQIICKIIYNETMVSSINVHIMLCIVSILIKMDWASIKLSGESEMQKPQHYLQWNSVYDFGFKRKR